MKVYIGPYANQIGPYQIAEKILFWKDKYEDDSVHEFGKWLAENKDGNESLLSKLCAKFYTIQKRKVKVKIDYYDTWSADNTLSIIIHPLLLKLKEVNHGAPINLDDEDVPEDIRSTSAPPKENEWDTDDFLFARWEYIIDEMIWAHAPDWEDKYEWKYDSETIEEYRERRKRRENGFRLFGKYYSGLWT